MAVRVPGDQLVELAHGAIEVSRDVVGLAEPILRVVGELSVRVLIEKLLKRFRRLIVTARLEQIKSRLIGLLLLDGIGT